MKKKWISTLGLACAVMVGASMTACSNNNDGENSQGAQEASLQSYVSIDINPSIELTLDSNNIVLSVYGANEDGEILLYEEKASLVGASLDTAVEKITMLAEEMGYFEDNTVVNTVVTSESTQKEQEIFNKINAKITAKGNQLGLTLTVDKEHAFSLIRQYQDYLLENNLTEEDLPIKDYKLALSASQSGEITLEAALELDKEQLIKIIHDAHDKAKEFATEELRRRHEEKMAEIDKLVDDVVSNEYVEYFITKGDFISAYNSLSYSIYNAYYNGLNVVVKALERTEDLRRYPLSEESITNIMSALQIDDQKLIQDHDGNVTIASVERYANKVIKNTFDEDTVNALVETLDTELTKAEEEIKAIIEIELAKFAPQVQAIIENVNAIVNQMDLSIFSTIGGTLTQDVTQMNEKLAVEIENGLTAEKIREYAEEMKEKADQAFSKIEVEVENADSDLTGRINSAKESINGKKEQIHTEIEKMREDVEERIQGLKNKFRGNQPQNV